MNLDEILSLIKVRDYMSTIIHNSVLERKDISEFGRLITLIDKKIINTLLSTNFKNSINIDKLDQVHNQKDFLSVEDMTKMLVKNNIKNKK